MYLFKTGFEQLSRVQESNLLSSKLPQAVRLLSEVINVEEKSGRQDLGEEVILSWQADLIETVKHKMGSETPLPHELYLYEVNFTMEYKDIKRSYKINVFRYKPLSVEASE